MVPFFFLNLDRTFEDGMWANWPPMPGPIRWMLTNAVGTLYGNWWRFTSCGADGNPRELFALEQHAKKSGNAPSDAKTSASSADENPTAHAGEL